MSIQRMYLCTFRLFVPYPCVYFGLLQPAALSSRVLCFPAFRPSHYSSSSPLSFLLLWFSFFPTHLFFPHHRLTHPLPARFLLSAHARTQSCVCVWGSCLLGLLAFSPHGSVECELPTSCYVRDTLLGVALPRAMLHTSTIDDTKVFLKIGANSSGGQSRFDDSRALRLFSASFALTRSSRRVRPREKISQFSQAQGRKKGRSENLGLKPFVHT